MPRAGLAIRAGVRSPGWAGHPASPGGNEPLLVPALGWLRLSQATIALTRGSHWPMYETPAAP